MSVVRAKTHLSKIENQPILLDDECLGNQRWRKRLGINRQQLIQRSYPTRSCLCPKIFNIVSSHTSDSCLTGDNGYGFHPYWGWPSQRESINLEEA